MPIHDWTRVNAGIFHDFHSDWIFTLKNTLNQSLLPPQYYALSEQVAGGLHRDVLALERKRATPASPEDNGDARAEIGGVAVAEAPPQVRFTASAEIEVHARKRNRIAIRHISGDQVVAMLEIVSPGNKSSRHALRAFVDKAVEFLDAGIHLLILDLFPPTPRDPQGVHAAIWSEIIDDKFTLPPDRPLTLVSYSAGAVKRAYIEPVCVASGLPQMPLFVEPEVYVPVPLEASYQAAFQAVPKRWREELEE